MKLFTERQLEYLILRYAAYKGQAGFTEQELQADFRIIEAEVLAAKLLLATIYDGPAHLGIGVRDGKVVVAAIERPVAP